MSDQMNVQIGDLSVLFRAAVLGNEQTLVDWLTTQTTHPEAGTILGNILRISALLGHVGFTEVLLNRNPELAIGVDSSRRTALHLASAEGHLQIVRRLLLLNNDICLDRDEEERIPLHYAAMRGRTEVVQELIIARPDSVSLVDGEERTVFHLCVIYNHLETLETLVKLEYGAANIAGGEPRPYIFLRPNRAGDTILHLASKFKRVEMVSYLLSIPKIRGTIGLENNKALTAQDILKEQSPQDFKICEIQHMLTMVKNEGELFSMKMLVDWLMHGDEWLEEMRGNLSLVCTVIATITFQALINPPGGFIQQGLLSLPSEKNTTSSNEVLNNVTSSPYDLNCTILHDNRTYCPGQAMASYSHFHPHFQQYSFYVTISFFSSLSVTLLLISGIFPIKNKAVIWILSVGMWIILISLAAAFINAMKIIIPYHLFNEGLLSSLKDVNWHEVWLIFLLVTMLLITLRISAWLYKSRGSWERKGACCGFLVLPFAIGYSFVCVLALVLVMVLFSRFFRF